MWGLVSSVVCSANSYLDVRRRLADWSRRAATAFVLIAIALCVFTVGLAALAFALYALLRVSLDAPASAAITAVTFLALAGVAILVFHCGLRRRAAAAETTPETLAAIRALLETEAGGVVDSVRRQPVGSMVAAVTLGLVVGILMENDTS